MNVTYIIPIKKHLAKYISPKDSKIYYEGAKAITFTFDYYAGYKIKKKELLRLYTENKLYKRIKPNQYPKEFISKYSNQKFIYLKFNFPVNNNRSNNDKLNEDYNFWIKQINTSLDIVFWRDCVRSILFNRDTTIDQAINDFYSFYDLTDFDYKISSFKRMLYKLNKN